MWTAQQNPRDIEAALHIDHHDGLAVWARDEGRNQDVDQGQLPTGKSNRRETGCAEMPLREVIEACDWKSLEPAGCWLCG